MFSQKSSLKLKMGLYLKRESFFASVPLDARCAPSFESCRVIPHECCKHLLLLLLVGHGGKHASYPLPSLPPQDKCSMHSYFAKIGHSSRPKNDLTYHRIQKLHEEAVGLVLRHPDLGLWKTRSQSARIHEEIPHYFERKYHHSHPLTYFVEQLAARAVLEEDELPVAGLVGPRSVASHNIVVPVSK